MKAQGADLRLGRAEWKPETSDVRLERADLMPMRTDLKLGRDNLRPCCLRGLILGLRGLIWGFRAPNWGRRGLILGLTRLIWCLRGMIWGLIDLFEAWEASFEADLGGGDGWTNGWANRSPPVFYMTLSPLGLLSKKENFESTRNLPASNKKCMKHSSWQILDFSHSLSKWFAQHAPN